MKAFSLQMAMQTALFALVCLAPGRAGGSEALQAKIEYCQFCHGPSGQGYRGAFPVPRIAGQTTEYMESQLQAFVERKRERNNPIVMSKTHGVGPAMRRALAAHFAALNPRPLSGAPRHLGGAGKRIYEEGVPEASVPACAACHGPDAKGSGANSRLAGQLYSYTVKEMVGWSKEREDTSSVMATIAHGMTRQQVEAVAIYLSKLK
jgi:cytochrome c553